MLRSLGPAVRGLLVACLAGFALGVWQPAVIEVFALWPIGSGFQPWQLLTYSFLHGGLWHLAFNMIGLVSFGRELEAWWGSKAFLRFWIASVLSAALVQLSVTAATGSTQATVGASGGLFGLLLGFAMMFPKRRILLLIPPIPMPAWLFVLLFGALELYLGVSGTASGIAHFAHLGGMLGGFWMLQRWRLNASKD
jgi:membrane associated rhomboid family serine protease